MRARSGENGGVAATGGKRAGSRRGQRRPVRFRRDVAVLALLVPLTLGAWGVLVWFAIDFGGRGRAGEQRAWLLMGATSVGAIACLFVALMLGVRLVRALDRAGSAAPATHSHAAPRRTEAPPVPPPEVNPYAEERGDTAERPRRLPDDQPRAG